MSGHSKWSTIKHKKGKADAARGRLFTKLIREITVSTRIGGKDIDGNPRLRSAVLTARAHNMPGETIERAIKRGAGDLEGQQYEELTYEGYGPGGVAFFIEAMTTNRNRTVSEIRSTLSKHGGNLGTDGSVAWMFDLRGYVEVEADRVVFDRLFEAAVEAGASDVQPAGDTFAVYCDFAAVHEVNRALEAAGFSVRAARGIRVPTNTVAVEGSTAESTLRLLDALDDLEDVQSVYLNADISDEEMARLQS